MTYQLVDNHKPSSLPKSVLQELDESLPAICFSNGFRLNRYEASFVATRVHGSRTVELKIHFPTSSESTIAIDHTVMQKTVTGRRVKSTRSLVSFQEINTTLCDLIKEPWSLIQRTSTIGSNSNASSKT